MLGNYIRSTTLVLRNLPRLTTEPFLLKLVEARVGPVATVAVPLSSSNLCLGHAYVEFHSREALESAAFLLRGLTIRGKPVFVHELSKPLDIGIIGDV